MHKLFFIFFLIITQSLLGSLEILQHKPFVDFECSDEFYIGGNCYRLYHVFDKKEIFRTIVSTTYGVIDFYNPENEIICQNDLDDLYDNFGNLLGSVKVLSDIVPREWFSYATSEIEMYSNKHRFLAKLDADSSRKTFTIRNPENNEPLVVATWHILPSFSVEFPEMDNNFLKYDVPIWTVNILDRKQLDEMKISNTFIVWVLLKHNQKHLPEPYYIPCPPAGQ